MRTPTRSESGFTLLEIMVTAGIITILAAASLSAIGSLRPRAKASSAAHQVVAAFQTAKNRAVATGNYVYLRFVPPGADPTGKFSGTVMCENRHTVYRPAAGYDPDDPCDGTCILPESGTDCTGDTLFLDRTRMPVGIHGAGHEEFEVTNDLSGLPYAFRNRSAFDVTTATAQGEGGCSFCGCTDCGGVGWIRFLPRGEIRFSKDDGDTTVGGAILLRAVDDDAADHPQIHYVSITEPYGLVRSFVNE